MPFGIVHGMRDGQSIHDLMMTQPLVIGEHVDASFADLISRVRIYFADYSAVEHH